jgi:hypothetical protein
MPDEVEKRIAFAIGHTKPLAETHPHLQTFAAFLEDFNKETARGAALAAAAFIDDLLEKTVIAFLADNESGPKLTRGFGAPLGTFAARVAACHAMGLISDRECRECEIIRKVRNEFAHKIRMSFDDDKVRGLCASLTFSAAPIEGGKFDARGQFTSAAVSLILHLTNRPHYVGERRLKYQDWKY